MRVALDANCFIDAVNARTRAYAPLMTIFSAARAGRIKLTVSRHTLYELSKKDDAAVELASSLEVLPHWPIGTFGQQVATWKDLAGTWEDAHRNEEIRRELESLAKSGNDIRDQGAYIDAVHAAVDVFVTSDGHLSRSGPADRLGKRFGLRVMRPEEFANEVVQPPC